MNASGDLPKLHWLTWRRTPTKLSRWHQPDLFFALLAGIVCFSRFRHGRSPLFTYDDDFFYYLKIAANVAHTGRSTFDGVHLTNGYHPLWFFIITVLYALVPTPWFFVSLQTCSFLLAMLHYRLLKQMLCTRVVDRDAAAFCAVFIATLATALGRGGMEVCVLFPCIVAALAYRLGPSFQWTTRQTAIYGFLLSLAILARLDAAMLVALLLACECTQMLPTLVSVGRTVKLLIGGFLFPAYLLVNRFFFHTWLPVSGQAKQLRFHHWPSLRLWASVFARPSTLLTLIVWGSVAVSIVALCCFPRSPAAAPSKQFALALLVFPVMYISVLSLLSDWPVWPWYFYPFLLSLVGSALLLLPIEAHVRALFQYLHGPGYAALLLLMGAVSNLVPVGPEYWQTCALASYINQHPGVYAMGDVSGLLSYMVTSPIVQTEGLTEDVMFVRAVRSQRPLRQVLQDFGATYYITGEYPHRSACVTVSEPAQAGPDSPHLRAIVCDRDALFQAHTDRHQVYAVSSLRSSPN